MSAGHHAHRDAVPAIDDKFYRRVTDLVDAARRDRDHTIPWLANRSIDGRTVYIDLTVPQVLPGTGINTGETLPYHELGEWLGMNEGLDYDDAHATRGNPCEKRRVEALGGDWNAYQAEMDAYIRSVADEAMTSVPADIDKRVFVDDDDKAALAAILADNKGFAMPLQRKFVSGAVVADTGLGPRQIRVVASDGTLDRAKDVMVPSGCKIDNYVKNNIVLADHDPTKPIGNAEIEVESKQVTALITFAPENISAKADEYCALAKAGVIKAVSVGFQPIEAEPKKDGGFLFKQWELMELSVLGGVPCNPSAVVIARAAPAAAEPDAEQRHEWKVGASRNLPLEESTAWDAAAAEKSIFEHCGFDGDAPNTGFARKAFLIYDAANPKAKSSYRLPFAIVRDGRLTAVAAGVRAAAARLKQAGIPDDAQKKARAVVDHFEGKMKNGSGQHKAILNQILGKNGKPKIKGLYDCAELARVVSGIAYIHDSAVWEAEVEQDASKLPAMLAELLRQAADALVAMTEEETAELLAGRGIEVLPIDEDYVAAAPTPQAKALRAAFRKAGRVLSAANLDHLDAVDKCHKAIAECQTKMAKLHDDLHDTLVDMMDQGTSAGEHVKAIRDSADKKTDDDEDDDSNNDDAGGDIADPDNSDQELAFAAQRKREIELLERSAPVC